MTQREGPPSQTAQHHPQDKLQQFISYPACGSLLWHHKMDWNSVLVQAGFSQQGQWHCSFTMFSLTLFYFFLHVVSFFLVTQAVPEHLNLWAILLLLPPKFWDYWYMPLIPTRTAHFLYLRTIFKWHFLLLLWIKTNGSGNKKKTMWKRWLITKPDNWSSTPRTHMVEEENQPLHLCTSSGI